MNKQELGMLIGLHAGDALGATLEFGPPRKREEWLTEIVGGGPFNVAAGSGTDDTEMMIAVLSAIHSRTEFRSDECLSNFLTWLDTIPKDVGNTTRSNLLLQKRGLPPSIKEDGQGNGSLMRCAPLAVLNLDPSDLLKVVANQCAITHPHPNCILADQIFIALLRSILKGEQSKENILKLADKLSLGHAELNSRIGRIPKMTWEQVKTSGYVFDTLCASLWAFYHCDSFEDALIQIVNRGDDSDTVGAVTGALCGAYYGIDQIPSRWTAILF